MIAINYLYTSFDIAAYLIIEDLKASRKQIVLTSLWQRRNIDLEERLRKDRRFFTSSVNNKINKLSECDSEFDELHIILQELGLGCDISLPETKREVVASYFKVVKLRLTYSDGTDHIRMKLKTLLGIFGYKRRTSAFMVIINETIENLGLATYLKGYTPCDISVIPINKMITIRLESECLRKRYYTWSG